MKYKGKNEALTHIGKELGCGVLVEGSVRKACNRIRVTVQVIDPNNEEHLWSSSLGDIFAVQDEIARKVSESLPNYVLTEKLELGTAPPDTKNVEAYTCYLKAMKVYKESTKDSLNRALELFTKATQLDPNFARAHIGLGNCYPELGAKSMMP